jgi:hypothetical protein
VEHVLRQGLGSEWSSLAPVIQAYYRLTPFADEQVRPKGNMDRVFHSRVVSPLIPVAALAGAMVPYQGHNIPVEVLNYSMPGQPSYFWHCTFSFPERNLTNSDPA